jgi:uncharacterized membrane protein YccC
VALVTAASSPAGVLREIGRTIVRFDRGALNFTDALRIAAGVALPLGVGLALHHPSSAVIAVIGALSAGFASLRGAYRTRALVVCLTAAGMAVSTFVGALAGHIDVLVVVLLAVWGLGAGLISSLGQAATVIGIQAIVALLVVSQYPMSVGPAAQRAGVVVGGAAAQLLLVTASWPLRRYPAERSALASAYRSMAGYARGLPLAPPDPLTVGAARRALADPQPFGNRERRAVYGALVDEAERVRTSLAGVARARDRLLAAGQPEAADRLAELTATAGGLLDDVAAAVERGAAPRTLVEGAAALERLVPRDGAGPADLDPPAAARARVLAAHVRNAALSAVDGARSPHDDPSGAVDLPGGGGPAWSGLAVSPRAALDTIRDNLSPRSAAFRHAVRLAVTLAATDALAVATGWSHGYWMPLTALVVLRPDFLSTFARGVGRIAGTLVGAGLATLVVATLRPGHAELAALIVALVWVGAATLRANYTVFAMLITAYVVLLLSLVGLPEVAAVSNRLLDTLIGGGVALAAFAAWPTWEATGAPVALAAVVRAQAEYACQVVTAYADPAARDVASLRRARGRARLARSDAEASVTRLAAEPRRRGWPDPDVGEEMLDAVRRFAVAALSLHANLVDARPIDAALVGRLADALRAALCGVADAVERGGDPPDLADLRAARTALTDALDPASSAVLIVETRLLAQVVEQLADQARRLSGDTR